MEENSKIVTVEEKGQTGFRIKENIGKWMGLFLALTAVILIYFCIVNLGVIASGFMRLLGILKPVIFGCIIAYLLNPLYKMYGRMFERLLKKKENISAKAKNITDGLSITLSLLTGILIIVVLCWMVLPQLIETVITLVNKLPKQAEYYYNSANAWIHNNKFLKKQMQDFALDITNNMESMLNKDLFPWLKDELLPNVNTFAVGFANGVISVFDVFYNLFIGIIVAIYLLGGKQTFSAQAKKLLYGIMKKEHADVVIRYVRISNETFSGFISGKLVDSTIIGILCVIVMWILGLPYAVLISVVVGVTNIIPVFGPYIGAIPSFLLILLVNPVQAIIFLVWIIILQQLDGNIIGPMILGESTGLSAFWVLFSILFFGGIWGIVGMLVGCPLFAVIYRIVKDIISNCLEHKKLSTITEDYKDLKEITENGSDYEYCKFSKDELNSKKKKENDYFDSIKIKIKKTIKNNKKNKTE